MTERLILLAIAASLAVPVLRYAVAFQFAEPALRAWSLTIDISPLTGLAFGASYEAIAFLGIREAFAARRRGLRAWWWPAAGSALQTIAGVAIILPVMVAEVRSEPLASLLGAAGCWLWSGIVAAATMLAFATAALALAVQPQKRGKSRGEQVEQIAKQFKCQRCGASFRSQQALNAHQRKHKRDGNG